MILKMTFKGPNTVADVTRQQPLEIGHAISFTTKLIRPPRHEDYQRIFEMERTFNELTNGRLHVHLIAEDDS